MIDPDGLQSIRISRTADGGAIATIIPAHTQAIAQIQQIQAIKPGFTYPLTGPRNARYGAGDVRVLEQILNTTRREFMERYPFSCPIGQGNGGVYALVNPLARSVEQAIQRSGRTNDFIRREGEHGRDPALRDFSLRPAFRSDNYSTVRGLEQIFHEVYNPPYNRIRATDPRKPATSQYLQDAHRYLENNGRGK